MGEKTDLSASINTFNAKLEQPLQGGYYGSVDAPNGPSKAGQAPSDPKEGGITAAKAMSVLQDGGKEYTQTSIDQLNLWMATYGDKAVASPTRWIFQSIDVSGGSADPGQMAPKQDGQSAGGGQGQQPQGGQGQQPQGGQGPTNDKWTQCYQQNGGKLSGVVSTNATQYIAGPPTFDETAQALDYKVAAPHYLPNGDVFQGTYNLQISDTLARCLYGFSNAPISATVSVVSIDGTAKVATTVVKDSGGFLQLSAAGFTFSSPTIRVKLFQEATSASTSKTSSGTSAKTPPSSITCIKGKLSKKVTGVTPKCPSGYSLKK